MTSVKQAGADPDAADDSGAKPIAAAAAAGEREVVEALFPLTQPADGVADWSVTGLMEGAASAGSVAKLSLGEDSSEQQPAAVRPATPTTVIIVMLRLNLIEIPLSCSPPKRASQSYKSPVALEQYLLGRDVASPATRRLKWVHHASYAGEGQIPLQHRLLTPLFIQLL